jgi:benzil reductase ((S)-benzoin forming)
MITHAAYEHLQVDLRDIDGLSSAMKSRLTAVLGDRTLRRVGLVNNAANPGLLGPIEHLDTRRLSEVMAVNFSTPVSLMGAFLRLTAPTTRLRIVNVSSGAAVLAAEIEANADRTQREGRVSILSYEPGTVDTPMQAHARAQTQSTLPSVELFVRFNADGRLMPPSAPAAEIADFLESDSREPFAERRFGS